jgi:hypothetical protein
MRYIADDRLGGFLPAVAGSDADVRFTARPGRNRNGRFEVRDAIKQTHYCADCQRQPSTHCSHPAEPRLNQGLAARCGHLHLSVGQSERECLLRDLAIASRLFAM